ncbi:tRNA N(3)-methylcytidine methyltransferase METTL8, mitochondrial isoform X2 [Falco peregrinus]|uniref:tRNA N(3)-methylcytidine methyltransferase METTL8, mitochondrial isoform X2 n=1 Tax=Falco peregrinus TaxID=8954 RepID=UPI002479C55C|nr:tRNA N(3)-methylcytidine methyltransferase METTL8, mitochondrial isoform X2 [Falco peregrinus]
MNFITRLSAFCLRKSKMQQRHQSSRRPAVPLGSRILTDPSKVFEHNMWDHMQWSQEEEENAKEKVAENSLVKVQWEDQDKYEREASKYWNEFYKTHKNNFFKDRNWLFLEFPEILPEKRRQELKTEERSSEHTKINSTNSFLHKNEMFEEGEKYWKKNDGGGSTAVQGYVYNKKQEKSPADNPQGKVCGGELGRLESFPGSDATYRILEVGCGAGNSVFPILKVLCNIPGTFLYCCDFASGAVELVKSHSSYNSAWCSAFVHDVCDDALPYPFPDEILDVILLVFVLSTIHPDRSLLVRKFLRTRRWNQSVFLYQSKTKAGACAVIHKSLNLKRTTKMQGRWGDSGNPSDTRVKFLVLKTAVSALSLACDLANL